MMNPHDQRRATTAARFLCWAACLAGAVLPAFAEQKECLRKEVLPPPPSDGVAIGDETIGTLPIVQAGSIVHLRRDLEVARPSVFLEGDRNAVCNVIVTVAGANQVEVVPLDPAYTRVRIIFPGQTLVGCDRLALESSDIKIGMWLPDPQSDAWPRCAWGTRQTTIANASQRLELPVAPMSAAGALDQRALIVQAGSIHGTTQLAVSTDADFLYLFQRQ